MREHVYDFENVVIGYGLDAVQYAYHNEYPLILNSNKIPFRFDETEEVSIPGIDRNLTRTEEIWSLLLFEHAMKGLVPFGAGPAKASLTGHEMTVSVRDTLTVNMTFEKCFIFEDDGILVENEIIREGSKKYRVFDWINVRVGMQHDVDIIEDDSDFVRNVIFYPSERIDGNHNRKDCVAVSYLTEEQLTNFDFSDTMVRFKVEKMMIEKGIKGSKSGFNPGKKQKMSSIKLEPRHRERELLSKTIYKDSEHVKFLGRD